jgi:hypothetical protein
MKLTPEQARRRFADRPQPTPVEFAGQWVAWNGERTRILAHGANFGKVRAEGISAGCTAPLMQRVLATPFVGSLCVSLTR